MNINWFGGRRFTFSLAGLIALASMIVVLAVSGISESHAAGDRMSSIPTRSAKAIAFHDQMRALWEAHGAWTHMVIVSFVGNLPNLPAEERVLLHNQVDIGNAVKPYYERAAANRLTHLLEEHILGAVTCWSRPSPRTRESSRTPKRRRTPMGDRSPTSCTPATLTSSRARRRVR